MILNKKKKDYEIQKEKVNQIPLMISRNIFPRMLMFSKVGFPVIPLDIKASIDWNFNLSDWSAAEVCLLLTSYDLFAGC